MWNEELVKNVNVFGISSSSSVHIDKRNKDIMIIKKGPANGLDDTKINRRDWMLNLFKNKINFVYICIKMETKDFFYAKGVNAYQFRVKDTEIKPYPLRLGNISKDFKVMNMRKTGLNAWIYDFSVDRIFNQKCEIKKD